MSNFTGSESGGGTMVANRGDDPERFKNRLPADWDADAGLTDRTAPDRQPSTHDSGQPATTPTKRLLIVRSGRVEVSAVVEIAGEVFRVEVDQGTVYLHHPRWSLMGAGDDMARAQADLMGEATDLLAAMSDMPASSMDDEARRLRDYLFRIASV